MLLKKFVAKQNTFNCMIVSYILVFLLPVLLIIPFVQMCFINEMYESAITSSINDTVFAKNVIDNHITQLFNIANSIFVDEQIIDSYHPLTQTSEVKALKTRLRILSLNAELPSETILYCVGDEYLFSTSSSISFSNFRYFDQNDDLFSRERLRTILDNLNSVEIFLPMKNTAKDNIIYAIPINGSEIKNKKKVVLFVINHSAFQKTLQKMLSNNSGCAFVYDDRGKILSYVNNDNNYDVNHFKQILQHVENSSDGVSNHRLGQNIKYNGKCYIINSIKSADGKLFYTAIMSRGIIIAQKSRQFMLWLWIIIAALVTGMVFAFFFAKVSYKPVEQLKKKIADKCYMNPIEKNDFDYIRSSFEYLISKNSIMKNNIKDITDYLVFKLFKGEICNVDEINKLNTAFDLSLYSDGFQVCVLAFDEYMDSDKITDHVSELLPYEVSFVLRMTASKYIYAMIVSFSSESQDSVAPFLKSLLGKISSLTIVAVGSIQNTIESIPVSYREASATFEYVFAQRRKGIQFYDDIKYSSNSSDIVECLSKNIAQGNKEGTIGAFLDIEKQLKEKSISIPSSRLLFVDLTILLIRKCTEMDIKNTMFDYPNIFLIQEYQSVESFIDMLKKMQSDCIIIFENLSQSNDADIISQMKGYINEHYDNAEFSLNMMADEFNMTMSSLSRTFKDSTGTNINDYITELRIKKAKKLLKKTDMPVYEIGKEIGYYNVNSFIRRFKQIVDETPGKFRREHT